MNVKSNSELSFGAKLNAGWTKEQLMKHYCMNEREYDKSIASLKKIRSQG